MLDRAYASRAGSHLSPLALTAAAVSRSLQRPNAGFTLTHGGRSVRFGPVAFWAIIATLVVMAAWSIGTGTYFAFSQDILTQLLGRQAEMRGAYENRVADLRTRLDRLQSRQLLDRELFKRKFDELLKRQKALRTRTAMLKGDFGASAEVDKQFERDPITDTIVFAAPPDGDERIQSRVPPVKLKTAVTLNPGAGISEELARVEDSLDRVQKEQTTILASVERHLNNKASRMRNVLDDLHNIAKIPLVQNGIGGPLVPIRSPAAGASAFKRQLYRVDIDRAEIDHFNYVLSRMPVRKPLPGPLEVTSPFGMRRDPFLGTPEMHTGVDLAGEIGEAVRATAAGKVMHAGWDGGYGNLVEIDHGNGLSTRYAHLSEIDVQVGQRVRAAEMIGRIGSTGRSTGPHLHYETRIDGKPVDPETFLQAGISLAGR